MPQTIRHCSVRVRSVAIIGLLIVVAAAAGCAQGQYIARATIQWPGASPRQMDEVIAKPVGRRLFGATNGVIAVTTISSAGKLDVYATSDGLTKEPVFLQAVDGGLADSTETLPRGAVAAPVEVLPKGEPVPQPMVHGVDKLRIDIDRARLIDAGLSYDDVSRAVAKAREQEAFRLPANVTITAPTAQHMIQVLNATTLPSREKPVTLGDVADVHVVAEPDIIVRHWP